MQIIILNLFLRHSFYFHHINFSQTEIFVPLIIFIPETKLCDFQNSLQYNIAAEFFFFEKGSQEPKT